jgi:hypothetical protein
MKHEIAKNSIIPTDHKIVLSINNIDMDIICIFYIFIYCIFTIYSKYLKRVTSKRDGCEYLKQVPSIDGSLELI